MAFKQFTQKDKSLSKELQDNRAEQEKLMMRLNQLEEHEQRLEAERSKETEIQRTAEMVRSWWSCNICFKYNKEYKY